MSAAPRILVTGGTGFLGRALLRELEKERIAGVRVFDLRPLAPEEAPGVESVEGDIRDREALARACRGVDVVFHMAARIDWGHVGRATLEEVNVGGTRNVVAACLEAGVRALVYTSSMDAVCGTGPVVRADETTPYPNRFANDYSRTKAAAEQQVLQADGAGLRTCVLRPCGMFGEGDPYHVANVLRVVEGGGLPFRIGDGRAAFQHVYVGNVAHAHLCAMRSLLGAESTAAGRVYFVTDDVPAVNFFDFMEPILKALGHSLPPASRSLPYSVAWGAGALLEATALALRPFARFAPALTRSSVCFVAQEHTFVGDRARRDLGYAPPYTEQEALARTIQWFRENRQALRAPHAEGGLP